MTLRKKSIAIFGVLALLVAGLCFAAGCSSNNQQQEQKPSISFGEEGENTKALTLENSTGKTITGVSVAATGQTDTKKLSVQGDTDKWDSDTKAVIYLPEQQGTTATNGSDEVKLRSSCDITFTCEDNTTYTVHSLTLSAVDTISDAKLNCSSSDNLFYLSYISNDSNVSTLASEQKIVADANAAAEAAAAQKAAEEAAAKAAAEAAASSSNTSSNSSTSSSSSSSSSSSGSSGSSQSSGGCVEGGVKLR